MTCQDSFHEVAFNISFWTRNISSARILFWRGVCYAVGRIYSDFSGLQYKSNCWQKGICNKFSIFLLLYWNLSVSINILDKNGTRDADVCCCVVPRKMKKDQYAINNSRFSCINDNRLPDGDLELNKSLKIS